MITDKFYMYDDQFELISCHYIKNYIIAKKDAYKAPASMTMKMMY